MAERTVCLCDGRLIGIETIYTVINGQQINNGKSLKELRAKSRNNELSCPCGCGSILILVAGEKNLREQHFRLKSINGNNECKMITESKISVNSKIVLKCWLDDKLEIMDIESRIPINAISGIERKYEFSFLSIGNKVALSYNNEMVNISEEKLSVLENYNKEILLYYIIDKKNGYCNGQYPEKKMLIQNRQGYCLLLDVNDMEYRKAKMIGVFYRKKISGLWTDIEFVEGYLSEFSFDENGRILCNGENLESLKNKAEIKYEKEINVRLSKIKEQEKIKEEKNMKKRSFIEKKKSIDEQNSIEEKKKEALRQNNIKFSSDIETEIEQQKVPVYDHNGVRWIKCEFCEKVKKESEFDSYGGSNHVNLGTCKKCSRTNPIVKLKIQELGKALSDKKALNKKKICVLCGGEMRKRKGIYGEFWGCSNYPKCKYTEKNTSVY